MRQIVPAYMSFELTNVDLMLSALPEKTDDNPYTLGAEYAYIVVVLRWAQ